MRTRRLSLLCLATLQVIACGARSQSEPAAGGAMTTTHPTGPIPGRDMPSVPVSNPLAGDAVAEREGRRLFVGYNCYGCHGGRGGGGMGPSLRDPTWIYGSTPADLFTSISEGRAHGMPAWGKQLPEQQIWQLVAYMQSLVTSREPDAPQ
jgi:cytochrome c oxidase cbb3-type subunit 3